MSSINLRPPQIELITDGARFFECYHQLIDKAEREILLETYIFDMDEVGHRVLDSLGRALARGVSVKILADGIGSAYFHWELMARCRSLGIPLRLYHPPPRGLDDRLKWAFPAWLRFFRVLNKRDHRKLLLVDLQSAMIGSFNLTRWHDPKVVGTLAWRDTAVRWEHPPGEQFFGELRQSFLRAWNKDARLKFRLPELRLRRRERRWAARAPKSFRLNDTWRRRWALKRDLLRRLRQAEKRILITNAYFVPRRWVLQSLEKAAQRGVFVGLLLPARADVWLVREASRALYRSLLKAGVHIYEYQPTMLHAKTLIIDDWGTVGSYNLNHRSLMHDLELEVALEDPVVIRQMIRVWDEDLRHSTALTLTQLDRDSWLRRTVGKLLLWVRYYL